MPIIATFYSIVVSMYDREHNPPHIHVTYNEYQATFDIRTIELDRGFLPKNAQRLVKEFITQYQNQLLEMWETKQFKKLIFKE